MNKLALVTTSVHMFPASGLIACRCCRVKGDRDSAQESRLFQNELNGRVHVPFTAA